MIHNIAIIGGPSTGKSERRRRVERRLGIPGIETSELLEEKNPDLVQIMQAGKLVDDNLVIQTILPNLPDRFIISGFPRTEGQSIQFWKSAGETVKENLVIFHLRRPKEVCRTFSARRGRGDDKKFEGRWRDYEKNILKVAAFFQGRIRTRWIELSLSDNIEHDAIIMADKAIHALGRAPRRPKIFLPLTTVSQ